ARTGELLGRLVVPEPDEQLLRRHQPAGVRRADRQEHHRDDRAAGLVPAAAVGRAGAGDPGAGRPRPAARRARPPEPPPQGVTRVAGYSTEARGVTPRAFGFFVAEHWARGTGCRSCLPARRPAGYDARIRSSPAEAGMNPGCRWSLGAGALLA